MSVQFGRWHFEGQSAPPDYIDQVSTVLAPYGPDSNDSYAKGGINILYRAFHTTKESRREKQPCISASGAVITWDGRLDNRADLISDLHDSVTVNSTDVAIVAAAFEMWGVNCLRKLIGDWALSIWNHRERFVLLAKDPIGTKSLYYSFDEKQLTWSTVLDPLVLFAGKTFTICEEYIAGWFSHFPATHLTPYVGIHAVPPSSFILLLPGKHIVSKYWEFDPDQRVRYRTDAEYEEHFRTVFANAVQRRLRSDKPVLAELSGGMDSSSIVCMADIIIKRGDAETPRLDTLSMYDDSNPDLDERPYFTRVEEKRGRSGCHIDLARLRHVGGEQSIESEFEGDRFAPMPIPPLCQCPVFQQYAAYVKARGHRITLSGLGGESATGGGVPSPIPELQNLLARARFQRLAHQLRVWAAKMGALPLTLLWETVRGFFPATLVRRPEYIRSIAPWMDSEFVRRNHSALQGYRLRLKVFGPLPSFQDNLRNLDAERRLLSLHAYPSDLLREIRYPFVDRSLLEFMYAVPREQVVRVGKRRSLMRRALVGIVPDELLNKRRRPVVPRETATMSSTERADWSGICDHHMVSSSVGIIDPYRFGEALRRARGFEQVHIYSLIRTQTIEGWLRHLVRRGVLAPSIAIARSKSYRGGGTPNALLPERFS